MCRFVDGDAFGEIALINEVKRTGTIIVSKHSDIITIEKQTF